jgi:hypothetical protein
MVLSNDDLDVMAEAYHLAAEQFSGDCTEPEISETLIEGLTAALRKGVRDENELARAALARVA